MSSGKPAARVGDQDTGHGIFGPTPITTGAGSVTIGGKPAARVGDMLAPHHPGARVIMKGSASVTIEGRPAARLGDPINCGGFIAMGEGSVCIGDAPAQLAPAPLSAAFSAYVKALLDPKTKVYSPDELKTLQDSIAVKYEPRFPGDTVGQLKARYAQQEAAAPLVPESANHQRTHTTSNTVTPTATPPQAAVDIRVVEADGLPAAGLPYLMTADDGTQRAGALDALGQAHESQLPAGQVTVTVGDPTNSTEIRHTRAGLREELARILQAERAEAAQLAAELAEKSAVGVYWAYRKAELRGLWNGTAGLISSLKELSDLALPLAHFQRAAKAAWQAWKHTDESPYLQAFHKNFTDAQFKELADVLGIDPRSITKAQLAEISALINFLWDDDQTRSILLKFAGQYIEAQHSIEVVETLYATVPEVAFDILITALTLGSGATVVIATKARWIDRLSGVGHLLKQLAQQLKKAKGQKSRVGYTGDRVDIEVERPDYQELEVPDGGRPLGARGPATQWDGFDEALAGGPVRNFNTDKIKITDRGIDVVVKHTSRFGGDEANAIMIDRLRQISRGDIKPTQQDLNFYSHELREYVRYRKLGWEKGVPSNTDEATNLWRQTHSATLDDYNLPLHSDDLLYHPDALNVLYGD